MCNHIYKCPYSTLATKHKYVPRTLILHMSIGHLLYLYVSLPPTIYVPPISNESLNHHAFLVHQCYMIPWGPIRKESLSHQIIYICVIKTPNPFMCILNTNVIFVTNHMDLYANHHIHMHLGDQSCIFKQIWMCP